jgi:putative MATE family efflux protein
LGVFLLKTSLLRIRKNQVIDLYKDREFFARLYKIAMPIVLQNFITSLLNMVAVVMIGQLGDAPVAAVALANQILFLLTLVLFGISSGAAIFTAQLWGKKDIHNIRKVLSISTALGLLGGLAFVLIAELAPDFVIGIYSNDPVVIELGGQYLKIFGWSFLFMAVSVTYSAVLRSIGDVKKPLLVTFTALSLNTILSYLLIFGKLGFPVMGILGAAVATLLSRILECGLLLWLTYSSNSPAAATLKELLAIDLHFAIKILKPVLPVALNELLWALGITTYSVVYAHIGTEAIAAMNIAGTVDNLAFVVFLGIASACSVIVGNQIGADEEQEAFRSALRSISLAFTGAILMGGVILISAAPILSLYKVSPIVIEHAHKVLIIVAVLMCVRVANTVFFVGVFRSGGDIRYAFVLDAGIIWIVGVPLAFLGAFVFHLPVYWVYLMVMADELTKFIFGIYRFLSKKWIHNMALTVTPVLLE